MFRNGIHGTTKTCITYDAINAAYLDARKRIRKLNFFCIFCWYVDNAHWRLVSMEVCLVYIIMKIDFLHFFFRMSWNTKTK